MMEEQAQASETGAWLAWSRRHLLLLSATAHVFLFAGAWFLAFGLAYNFKQSATLARPFVWVKALFTDVGPPPATAVDWFVDFFLPLLIPVVTIKLTIVVLAGLHRASWRYVSLRDVFSVARAAWWSFFVIFLLYYGLQNLRLIGIDIPAFGEKFSPPGSREVAQLFSRRTNRPCPSS